MTSVATPTKAETHLWSRF